MIIKVDLHVHSDASPDGRSSLDKLTKSAKEKGIEAIAVTDHNAFSRCPESMNGVLIIPGIELSTKQGHITGLFLEDEPEIKKELPDGSEAVAEIRRRGGIAVLAHPFQKGKCELPEADAVETANSRAAMKIKEANSLAAAYAREMGLPGLGGSDAHSAGEIGSAYTELEVCELTLTELKKRLLSGKAVLVRECSNFTKGLSQFRKAKNSRNIGKILKGVAYLGVCVIRDIKR
ncbi:MAG: PHP domain-containing protein [Clostridia bacterium]|nr:PHP domain-containing protein [Clostridia bacterium]